MKKKLHERDTGLRDPDGKCILTGECCIVNYKGQNLVAEVMTHFVRTEPRTVQVHIPSKRIFYVTTPDKLHMTNTKDELEVMVAKRLRIRVSLTGKKFLWKIGTHLTFSVDTKGFCTPVVTVFPSEPRVMYVHAIENTGPGIDKAYVILPGKTGACKLALDEAQRVSALISKCLGGLCTVGIKFEKVN
jgi:hypothetical protein